MSAQMRALKDYAKANGYSVAREYVDEAESGRVADRPQFREMIEEGSQPKAPFEVILVWKFSRLTRKREHAVASPTGKLMEAIIESVDEFYSENLAQDVVRGMRNAASRGFFLASKAPYGYKRVHVQDGAAKRPKLEPRTRPQAPWPGASSTWPSGAEAPWTSPRPSTPRVSPLPTERSGSRPPSTPLPRNG